MNNRTAIIAIAIAALVAGCVRSFYPLFTEKDLVFNPALVGTWADKEKNTWTFQKSSDKNYRLLYFQREYKVFGRGPETAGDTATFRAQLGKLKGLWFLDLYPDRGTLESHVKNDLHNVTMIPTHTFFRVWIEGDSLRLAMLDEEWLKRLIDQNGMRIPHVRTEDYIVLTASTQELQRLVVMAAGDEKAFPNPGTLLRVR
jgi:hypothetical protein